MEILTFCDSCENKKHCTEFCNAFYENEEKETRGKDERKN